MENFFEKESFPLVSIVTPAYNQAEYLSETIESVLAQSYPNIEYIVIDDGSTDHTENVARKYGDKISFIRQENSGQAATLNRGWAMSSGSILGYLSADDLLAPNAVEILVTALQKKPGTNVVYCDFDLIDANGKRFRTIKAEDFSVRRLTVDLVCQPGPGALFRREIFEKTIGWNERLRQIPDFEFWLRVSKFGDFMRIDKSLAFYRVHHQSASYRPVNPDRSSEIINVVKNYWGLESSPDANKSIANAKIISGKSHFQSNRIQEGFRQMAGAVYYSPKVLVSVSLWRSALSGMFRKVLYFIKRFNV